MRFALVRATPVTKLKKILRAILACAFLAGFGAFFPDWCSYATFDPTFKSRQFENGKWPEGCALCGDHSTRTEDFSRLKGVPYCGVHGKAVRYAGEEAGVSWLQWRSLTMMRKYLAANRELADQPMASAGTRRTLVR